MNIKHKVVASAILAGTIAFSSNSFAVPFILSNGLGDGTVSIGVDGFGSFGSAIGGETSDATYDPVGAVDPAGTSFESSLAIRFGNTGLRDFLTSGDVSGSGSLPNPGVSGNSNSGTSSFSYGVLGFSLNQTLVDSFENGQRVGTQLNQQYTITNTSANTASFELVRYLDGDLLFDGTLDDGGGRLSFGGNDVVYETDAASGDAASTTFVGITGNGGIVPTTNRFEVDSYSGLRSRIREGVALDDMVEGDTNGDGFIDSPYDVTLALRNEFNLAPGQTTTYLAQTLFGNAIPAAPGSSESLPLLPPSDEPPFVFEIDPVPNETVWIDPIVAIGYDYAVTGNKFASVSLPSAATIPVTVPYELYLFDGSDYSFEAFLNAGDIYTFDAAGVDMFRILLDPSLGLDPANPLAFPTGVNFVNNTTAIVSMTPLAVNTTTDVPEPSTYALFAVGLLGFATSGMRKKRISRK